MAQHFAPEDVSGATLATQLVDDFVRSGMEVTFLTAAPSYPAGKVFPGYRNSLYSVEKHDRLRIVRTWSHISPSKSTLSRLLNYATFSAAAFFAGLVSGDYDIVFSYSPPLPLGISAWWLSRIKRIPWILRVEDLYPDAAIAAGVLKNKTAIRFFHWIEKTLYRHATHISLISDEFRKNLLAKGIDPQKLSVTPVWADPQEIQPGPKENEFRVQHGLQEKFIVLYAGNLGQTSALEDVVAAAEQLQNELQICFLFVGEGIKKKELEQEVLNKHLKNVCFLPYQLRETVPAMLAAADVCLVTLNPSSSSYSLPSKTFHYMAAARPILSLSPDTSEIAMLMRRYACGVNIENGDILSMKRVLLLFKNDPSECKQLGENGRHALEGHYSRAVCVDQFRQLIAQYAD